jgi:hypothetical protein
MQSSKRHLLIAASALGLGITGLARAHSNEHHAKKSGPVVKEQKDWGIAGDAKSVRRTIEVRTRARKCTSSSSAPRPRTPSTPS